MYIYSHLILELTYEDMQSAPITDLNLLLLAYVLESFLLVPLIPL